MVSEIQQLKIQAYEEKLHKEKAELRFLQLQLTPHFFINNLNVIYSLAQVQDYAAIGDMVMAGANCYTYNNGFLHSKGMIVDGKVLCYGTANMDIRSFALNFEVNAVIYDEKRAQEMVDIFQKDLEVCRQITRDYYVARRLKIRIKEQICRLLSPLL